MITDRIGLHSVLLRLLISCLVPLKKSRNILSHNVKRAGGYHVKVYLHFNVCLITPVLIKVLFFVSNTPRASYHLIHHMVGWYILEKESFNRTPLGPEKVAT